MWYLTEEKDASPSHPARPTPRYWLGGVQSQGRTIGRKHVDIRLKASSVSRTHAKISILKAAFYSPTAVAGRSRHPSTCVSVQDSSAYGTFLKYPSGHFSNRTEGAAGHHRRLDKDTPTEVSEGALLAFGAPSAWWRLGWKPILVIPSRLSSVERERLSTIANLTSLEVADSWAKDVTHFVTAQCVSSSFNFLAALAEGKYVVTMAWVEALRHTVGESCRAITDAANDITALSACALSDEKLFIPPFSSADQATFTADELAAVFDPAVKNRRATLFKDLVFVFSREERRARWVAIIEAMGGTAVLAKTLAAPSRDVRVVYVQGDQGLVKRPQDAFETAGRTHVPESAVITAIMRADTAALDTATSSVKAATAEVTDVATPGPLDESDGDTDDSEPAHIGNKQGTRQVPPGEDTSVSAAPPDTTSPAGTVEPLRGLGQQTATKKRARVLSAGVVRPAELEKRAAEKGSSIVADSSQVATVGNAPVDDSGVNVREFFKVDDISPAMLPYVGTDPPAGKLPGRNVRPFRRRNLLKTKIIPLKRVRYERAEGGVPQGSAAAESMHQVPEDEGASGARAVDSEEE